MRQLLRAKRQRLMVAVSISIIAVTYVLIMALYDYPGQANNFNMIVSVLISAYMIYAVRRRADLLIVMVCIFYENYSIAVGCYIDPSIRPGWMFRQFSDGRAYTVATLSLLLFELTIFLGYYIFSDKIDFEEIKIEEFPDNRYIMIGCMAIYVLLFVTQVTYDPSGRASSNALNEYKFILLIIGSLYSPKVWSNKIIWTALVGLTSVMTYFGGNRVNTLGNVFILAILWYRECVTIRNVALVAIPSIFVMLMIGVMRADFVISLNAIRNIWDIVSKEKFVADSFTFAYGPTIAAEELRFNISNLEKISLLTYNILYIVIGGSLGKYSLSNYTRNYYMHYFGFLGANYFDIWFGAFGGIIAALSVFILIFWRRESDTKIWKIIRLGAFASTFRWYNYNFMQIFRSGFVIAIVFIVFNLMDQMVKRNLRIK